MSVLAAVVGDDAARRVGGMLCASHRIGDGAPAVTVHEDIAVGIRLGVSSGSVHRAGDLTVLVDGWIDGIKGLPGPRSSRDGASLLTDGYRRYGTKLFPLVRGDYALVILDHRTSTLLIARDRAGAKPCFLAQLSGEVLMASQIAMLRSDGKVSAEPDEAVIAEQLAGSYANPTGTLLRDVTRLGAASILQAHRGDVRTWPHWDPHAVAASAAPRCDPPATADSTDLGDQLEQARDLLDRAVERRLGDRPIALELSGGLDSSSVVGTVAKLRPTRAERGTVATVSLRMPAGGHGDEWQHVEAVHHAWGLPSISAVPTLATRAELEDYARRTCYLPASPNGYMWSGLKQLMVERGFEISLSGTGGDEWFQRSTLWPAEVLSAGDLTGLRHALRVRRARSAGAVVDLVVRPAVRETAYWQRRVPAWVSPDLALRTDLGQRLVEQLPAASRRTARSERARVARSAWGSLAFEGLDRHNSLYGTETRHPLWDEDLVEFALRLPESVRWADTHPRGFQSGAFADRLPLSVASRRDKAHFADLSIQTIDVLGGWERIAAGVSAREGWIDLAEMEQVYGNLRTAHAQNGRTPGLKPIWNLLSLDLWLETL